MPSYQRPAVLSHGPLLLSELLPPHGQLSFRACNGFSHFSIPAPARGQAGLGFLDMLYCGAHIAREIAGVQRLRDYQFV